MQQNYLTKKEIADIKRQEKLEAKEEASIDRLAMFRNKKGYVKYNNICSHCERSCKQSFRVKIVECRPYTPYKEPSKHRQNDQSGL